MNAQDAWNNFLKSGSVLDYINYKAVKNSTESYEKPQGNANENKDRGTSDKTTEYR